MQKCVLFVGSDELPSSILNRWFEVARRCDVVPFTLHMPIDPVRFNLTVVFVQNMASKDLIGPIAQFPDAFIHKLPLSPEDQDTLIVDILEVDQQGVTSLCRAAMKYAYNRLDDPNLSVSSICTAMACSHDRLEREFASSRLPSIWKWIIEQRLKEANRLLKTTSLRVSEIARAVGYVDAAVFSRAYRLQFKTSPSDSRT